MDRKCVISKIGNEVKRVDVNAGNVIINDKKIPVDKYIDNMKKRLPHLCEYCELENFFSCPKVNRVTAVEVDHLVDDEIITIGKSIYNLITDFDFVKEGFQYFDYKTEKRLVITKCSRFDGVVPKYKH